MKAWQHQAEDLEASWRFPAAAIPWPPRLGKSKLAIDTVSRLYHAGEIDAAVVVAPNGVHLNWTRKEIPAHSDIPDPLVIEWSSGRAGTVAFKKQLQEALTTDRFVWIAVNTEAIATPKLVNMSGRGGMGFLERFVKRRRAAAIIDESHRFKNPKAKRTKALFKLRERFPFRRTLTGTPTSQGPFDLWSQYFFLDPTILGRRFTTFKHRYGIFERRKFGSGPAFDELVDYQNLDELNERIAPVTFPRVKEECLDLPERIFDRRYFVLPREHRRVYDQLRNDLLVQLKSEVEITAPMALTNLLRLQQITRGFVRDDEGTDHFLGSPYPSAEAVVDLVTENDGKTIVWCRFVPDVDVLAAALKEAGVGVITCDGRVPMADRPALRDQFEAAEAPTTWLGTLATGSEGIDLGSANLMVFYSHGFDRVQRVQGLERNFGSSQKADRIDVVDLIAADTADTRALDALDRKEDLARQLTGRKLKELIE